MVVIIPPPLRGSLQVKEPFSRCYLTLPCFKKKTEKDLWRCLAGDLNSPRTPKYNQVKLGSVTSSEVETVPSELGYRKGFTNYMTFELGLQGLVSVPDST